MQEIMQWGQVADEQKSRILEKAKNRECDYRQQDPSSQAGTP